MTKRIKGANISASDVKTVAVMPGNTHVLVSVSFIEKSTEMELFCALVLAAKAARVRALKGKK